MKLHNRIMSWILSPGAYALWHSMGNPEEWTWHESKDNTFFQHKSSKLLVQMDLWWRLPAACYIFPPLWIVVAAVWALWPWLGFHCVDHEDAFGPIDGNLIAGRAMRLRSKLLRLKRTEKKRKANQNLFTLLTVNEVTE